MKEPAINSEKVTASLLGHSRRVTDVGVTEDYMGGPGIVGT
jgi:hypothetical protein